MSLSTSPRLKFGLFMQPVHHPRENPTLALERDLQLLEHLDRLGFDQAWIGEHHSTGWETINAPDIFIAAAAARTQHIHLGTGIVPLPVHHPLHVVDRAILLDHLTRGRTMLGVGVGGGLPSDLHVFGLNRQQASERFQEAFDVVMQLLTTTEPMTLKTDWFELRDVIPHIAPFTQPHMPIGIPTDNPETLEKIGRYGAYLLTGAPAHRIPAIFEHIQRGAEQAGRTASRDQILLAMNVHLAPTREQALADVRDGATEEHFDFKVAVNGAPLPDAPRDTWADSLPDKAIIGTPDDAIERITAMLETSGGFGGILIQSKEWTSREAIWRSYELFARYVMPHFQGSLRAMHHAADIAAAANQREFTSA